MTSIHGINFQGLKSESLSMFAEGISLALTQWNALQMAIQNEWGGRDSLQKSENLAADILSWFSQPKVALSIDDLEHLLDEHMMLSFNTDTEDGSIEEVAEELMTMHEDCLHGHYESIEKLRKSTFKVKSLSQLRQVTDD
ncbi:hypothetical protein IFM89_017934 [Coptis chinensis]|uniref:Pre-rRNA-processing protein TSR2 homolog n=1 Tax=Coptis chinensis TaxID=261450 RepID=A0A835LZW6_9MAGN|nr:hypothetical protein IFM89_017934 [Coptis chinensis]